MHNFDPASKSCKAGLHPSIGMDEVVASYSLLYIILWYPIYPDTYYAILVFKQIVQLDKLIQLASAT